MLKAWLQVGGGGGGTFRRWGIVGRTQVTKGVTLMVILRLAITC